MELALQIMNDAPNAQSVSKRVGAAAALIRHVWKHKEGEGALHGGAQHACRCKSCNHGGAGGEKQCHDCNGVAVDNFNDLQRRGTR